MLPFFYFKTTRCYESVVTNHVGSLGPTGQELYQQLQSGLPCGRLLLKLATTPEEQEAVFRLRYRIFNEELGEGIPENAATGMDQDAFDPHCDHLMVLAENASTVVGTYRLLFGPKKPAAGFYSETEFDLKNIGVDLTQAVELGRGCIEAGYRKQSTLISLFWGLRKYMDARGARYLFGCASLPPVNADDAEASYRDLLQNGHVSEKFLVTPLKQNSFTGNANAGQVSVPQLVSFYLQFGAKILGRPAHDPIFRCYDLLMLFDMDHLSEWGLELLRRFEKRVLGSRQD